MRLSARSRYAVRLLLELALCKPDLPTPPAVLAERTGITPLFVEQLLKLLRKAGLTKSKRGATGGHSLAKPSREITLFDVVDLMEGGLSLLDCCQESPDACFDCPRMGSCPVRSTWQKVIGVLRDELRSISLADILASNGHTAVF